MILSIILSSNFVWNVDIVYENGEIIENISKDLEDCGLKTGVLKRSINTKDIINKIRLKRNDIAWMGIETKGTNVIVKIVKATKKPDIINDEEYCNIVSNKAGIITKINAQNGTANVKVGDTVNNGDILINGYMEGKYTGIRYVHAIGEIEAKVWYTKSTKIKLKTTERKETGNVENYYGVEINKFKINFKKRVSKFKIYDTIENKKKLKLFSDFYLPISIIKTTNKEVVEEIKKYNIEEAKTLGIKQIEKELNEEIENKESIVNKNINFHESNDEIEVFVTYEVLENIGTNEKITF